MLDYILTEIQIPRCFQVLSDEGKRKDYDTWGATSDQMGGGAGASQDFGRHQNWNFTSSIDPEELFRKIFGQAGFQRGGQFGDYNEDFAESRFGFGAAQEVRNLFTFDVFSH